MTILTKIFVKFSYYICHKKRMYQILCIFKTKYLIDFSSKMRPSEIIKFDKNNTSY